MAKAKVHPVEQAILKATKLKRKKKQDEQEFLTEVVVAVNELEEADFEALPEDAQLWYNAAATAYQDDEELPAFDADLTQSDEDEEEEESEDESDEEEESGDDADADEGDADEEEESEDESDEGDADEEEPEEEEEEEKPAKKAKGKRGPNKTAKDAKGKKGKAKDEDAPKRARKPRGGPDGKPAVTGRIVQLVTEHYPDDISVKEMHAQLESEGYQIKTNTVSIQGSFVKRVVALLDEQGKLSGGKGSGKGKGKKK